MELDAELMFECLIYLNAYYYPVLASCTSIMAAAKWQSILPTPNIGQDASVAFSVLLAETLKLILFNKFKEVRRDLITGVAVVLTYVTLGGVFYTLRIQDPVCKLEYILSAMTLMLASTEAFFGTLQLLPCFKKVQYY